MLSFSCIVLIASLVWIAMSTLSSWSDTSFNVPKAATIHFPTGTTLDELSGALEAAGVIDNALFFKVWLRINGSYQKYQAGTYRFSGNITPQVIDRKMTLGDTYAPVVLQFVIPEGFTLKQIINRLVANGVGDYETLWQLTHDTELIRELKVKANSLEGYIYPATYSTTSFPTPTN